MATVQNDNLATIIRDLVILRDNLYADFSQLADELIAANVEPEPIPDAYVRVPSFTREGVDHVVRVSGGKVRCGCEAATFKPEQGECKHVRAARIQRQIDPRAEFIGGF